jgi:hypothetical protein
MSGMLTTATVMMCPHGGTVQAIPSSTAVQFGGAPTVTAADTFMIAGCAFNIVGVPSPCLTVQWVSTSLQNQVNSNPALTEASVGLCLAATQAPQGPVTISSTQPQVSGT